MLVNGIRTPSGITSAVSIPLYESILTIIQIIIHLLSNVDICTKPQEERGYYMSDINNYPVWPGWETVRLIGRGSFGAVYEIQRDVFGHTEKAALKAVSIPQNDSDIEDLYDSGYDEASVTATFKSYLESIVAEYSLMREMNGSANVVNCDDFRIVQHDDNIGWDIYIKMELLIPLPKATDMHPDDKQVIQIAKDMCRALILCRKYGIIHRDIKPQNIFVSKNGDYKLGDFGIAKTIEKTSGGTKIGTYKYMAPEVYNNRPYNYTADLYSLGLVLYWLLNERRSPFMPLPPAPAVATQEESARTKRFSGTPIPAPAHGSEDLQRIVLKACTYDPKDRYPNADEMLRDLEAIGRETKHFAEPDTLQTAYVSDEGVPAAAETIRRKTEPSPDKNADLSFSGNNAEGGAVENKEKNTVKIAPEALNKEAAKSGQGSTYSIRFKPARREDDEGDNDKANKKGPDHNPLHKPPTSESPPFRSQPEQKPARQENSAVNESDADRAFPADQPEKRGNGRLWAILGLAAALVIGFYLWTTRLSDPSAASGTIQHTLGALYAADADQLRTSGTTENGLSWSWDNGVLTISGLGPIESNTSWNHLRQNTNSVVIEEGVTAIGQGAFQFHTQLTSVSIPETVSIIDNDAFYYCTSLKRVAIPKGVSSIGDRAFYGCFELIIISIPESVKSIGICAFSSCSHLEVISIPKGISAIGQKTFSFCTSLSSITIPEGVTSIGEDAFYYCSELTSVTIPKSLSSVSKNAFHQCSGLKDIYYKGSKKQWGKIKIAAQNVPLKKAKIHYST